MYLGKRFGFVSVQIPVEWAHDEESKVRVMRDVLRSLKELFLIACYTISGAYSADTPRNFTHKGVILAASLMALLIASPIIAFPYYAGARYHGINIAHFGSDEHLYLTRGKEVLDGHRLGQPCLSEFKDVQDATFSYAERILLLPATFLGLADNTDVVAYYNVANAFGVFVLVLLMYAFAFALSGDVVLSIAAAVCAIDGYSIIYHETLFYNDFNIYGRSVYPYMSSIPFFAFLWFLHRATIRKGGMRLAALAGLSAGLLFYIYFYGWTFACAVMGSLGLVFLALRRWHGLRETALAFVIAAVAGVPVLWSMARFFSTSAGTAVSYFLMASHGHTPVFSLIGLVANNKRHRNRSGRY